MDHIFPPILDRTYPLDKELNVYNIATRRADLTSLSWLTNQLWLISWAHMWQYILYSLAGLPADRPATAIVLQQDRDGIQLITENETCWI